MGFLIFAISWLILADIGSSIAITVKKHKFDIWMWAGTIIRFILITFSMLKIVGSL